MYKQKGGVYERALTALEKRVIMEVGWSQIKGAGHPDYEAIQAGKQIDKIHAAEDAAAKAAKEAAEQAIVVTAAAYTNHLIHHPFVFVQAWYALVDDFSSVHRRDYVLESCTKIGNVQKVDRSLDTKNAASLMVARSIELQDVLKEETRVRTDNMDIGAEEVYVEIYISLQRLWYAVNTPVFANTFRLDPTNAIYGVVGKEVYFDRLNWSGEFEGNAGAFEAACNDRLERENSYKIKPTVLAYELKQKGVDQVAAEELQHDPMHIVFLIQKK